jgi:hypothetical protein
MAKKQTSGAGETSDLVTVRVTGQPVCEDNLHYAKGDTFETTAERAAALGELVELATTPTEA